MKPSLEPRLSPGQLATIGQRVVGALVDLAVAGALFGTPFMLLSGVVRVEQLGPAMRSAIGVAGLVFMTVYNVVPTALSGRTLGKLVVGTMVVRRRDGRIPGWVPAALRWVLPALAWRVPGVGWLVAVALQGSLALDPLRRGLHDRLADTIVVQAAPRSEKA